MSGKLKIFIAHSKNPDDLDLMRESNLEVHLRDMKPPGQIELLDRGAVDENDLVDALRGVRLIVHLISPGYPADDDALFYLQIVEAVHNFSIPTVPLLLYQRSPAGWLAPLYEGVPQQLLLDRPLYNHPQGLNDAAFAFCQALHAVLSRVEEIAPDLPDLPAVAPELLQQALQQLNFTDQRAKFRNEFLRSKRFHLIYLQGTPDCGHSLLLRYLERTAGIYRDNARTDRVNLSVDPSLPAEFTVWDRLADRVIPAAALKYIPKDQWKKATIDGLLEELNEKAGSDRLFYLTFDNNQPATLKKIREFWDEFNEGMPPAEPPGRLFFFVIDLCGVSGPEPALSEADLCRHLHAGAGVLPLPPIGPVRRPLVENWIFENFDATVAPQLHQFICKQIDQIINTYGYIRTFILKICELLYRKDVYQKLFGDEII